MSSHEGLNNGSGQTPDINSKSPLWERLGRHARKAIPVYAVIVGVAGPLTCMSIANRQDQSDRMVALRADKANLQALGLDAARLIIGDLGKTSGTTAERDNQMTTTIINPGANVTYSPEDNQMQVYRGGQLLDGLYLSESEDIQISGTSALVLDRESRDGPLTLVQLEQGLADPAKITITTVTTKNGTQYTSPVTINVTGNSSGNVTMGSEQQSPPHLEQVTPDNATNTIGAFNHRLSVVTATVGSTGIAAY